MFKYFVIDGNTTKESLESDYKNLMILNHPDKNIGNAEAATEITKLINAEYAIAHSQLEGIKKFAKANESGRAFCFDMIEAIAEVARKTKISKAKIDLAVLSARLIINSVDTTWVMNIILSRMNKYQQK